MQELREKAHQAIVDNDYSLAIRILDEMAHISRISTQRKILKNILNNSEKERKENYTYCFITINPMPTITLADFISQVNKLLQKKWLTKYVYVYEQRSPTLEEIGKGFHMHMIFVKPEGKSQAHCIREIQSTFKKQCDTSNYHCFNTKWIGEEEYIRKLEYILGQKESTSENQKDQKQAMDRTWREMRSLQQYYSLNIDIGHYAT